LAIHNHEHIRLALWHYVWMPMYTISNTKHKGGLTHALTGSCYNTQIGFLTALVMRQSVWYWH